MKQETKFFPRVLVCWLQMSNVCQFCLRATQTKAKKNSVLHSQTMVGSAVITKLFVTI